MTDYDLGDLREADFHERLKAVPLGEFVPVGVEIVWPDDQLFELILYSDVHPSKLPTDPDARIKYEKRGFRKCPCATPEGEVMLWKRVH